jgi:hypothetical protein
MFRAAQKVAPEIKSGAKPSANSLAETTAAEFEELNP